MWSSTHFYIAQYFSEWKMLHTKFLDNTKKHILHPLTFFFYENRAFCEMMRKNTVQQGMTKVTIRRMRIALRISKVKNTHS